MRGSMDRRAPLDPVITFRSPGPDLHIRELFKLHTPISHPSPQLCRQLIDGGVEAVDWVELYGQK